MTNNVTGTPTNNSRMERIIEGSVLIVLAGMVLVIVGMGILTWGMQDACQTGAAEVNKLLLIACWLDPIFMTYNLSLLLFIVMIVPFITYFYVTNMKDRKLEILLRQLPDEADIKGRIDNTINETFQISHYAGSMTLLSLIIFLGGMIILLLKPMAIGESGTEFGVDYSKGANFLMLGSYMHLFVEGESEQYYRALIGTLTAFQFGFLGAFVYFITHLVRSYFTLDLSPNVYISSSVRIMMGTVLSLILSFYMITQDKTLANMESDFYYLPVMSFFIGFFPKRALLFLEHLVSGFVKILPTKYQSTSLTNLSGMSYQHELRLNREGFDNVENFVSADVVDLALRTGFSYQQLNDWKNQARLMCFMGEDYSRFKAATGIGNVAQLDNNREEFEKDYQQSSLNGLIDAALYRKTVFALNSIDRSPAT